MAPTLDPLTACEAKPNCDIVPICLPPKQKKIKKIKKITPKPPVVTVCAPAKIV